MSTETEPFELFKLRARADSDRLQKAARDLALIVCANPDEKTFELFDILFDDCVLFSYDEDKLLRALYGLKKELENCQVYSMRALARKAGS